MRLIGGRLSARQLQELSAVAGEHGPGGLHLTGRANLQLRGMPLVDGGLPPHIVSALIDTGLVPTPSHDLVRNVLVSPQTGLVGGRADLRPVAANLDRIVCSRPRLADLPGRFLFVLDDGRGDLIRRDTDLGLVALDEHTAQLRIGSTGWGSVVDLVDAAGLLADLALDFLDRRGSGPSAPWHVDELAESWTPSTPPDPRTQVQSEPLPYGIVAGGIHVEAPGGVLTPTAVVELAAHAGPDDPLVVTPWRGILVPAAAA